MVDRDLLLRKLAEIEQYVRELSPPTGRPGATAIGSLQTRPDSLTVNSVMLDRIKIDPAVCEGRPTIRGMRITVDFVLKLLGDGYTADDIVREYPELEKEDVYQAAKYGAWLASEKTSTIA